MARTRLAADTVEDIERRQVEAWRRMTSAEEAATVVGLTQAVYDLARAGVQHRHPDASPREQFLRLVIVILGADACRAYPDIATLDWR
jgi:hypothetical protein